jgi:hypothetical protein
MSSATFRAGQESIGTTAKQLDTPPPSGAHLIIFKAHSGNSGRIYVGTDDGVSASNGFELPEDYPLEVALINAYQLWWVSSDSDDVLCWCTTEA